MYESETTEDLKSRVLRMSEYYLKGMGNSLQDIVSITEVYAMGRRGLECLGMANKEYTRIEDLYARIPFDDLKGQEDFAPLFIVRDILPRLKTEMDEAFSHPSDDGVRRVCDATREIVDRGFKYWYNMIQMLKYVQRERGEKDFHIHLVDCKGKEWTF